MVDPAVRATLVWDKHIGISQGKAAVQIFKTVGPTTIRA